MHSNNMGRHNALFDNFSSSNKFIIYNFNENETFMVHNILQPFQNFSAARLIRPY